MKPSLNRKILRNLLRRERNFSREDMEENLKYLILYSFLYKYLSDNLKKLLKSLMPPQEDLKFFFEDDEYYEMFQEESLENLGYFFKNYNSFMDAAIFNENYDGFLADEFFSKLQENLVYKLDSEMEDYFRLIFDILNHYKPDMMSQDHKTELILGEYVKLISKLDIDEKEFTFQQVYDVIASSRIIRLDTTPDYLSSILTKLISSKVGEVNDAYDPFLKDASTLIGLTKSIDIKNIYGKEENRLNFFYSLIKGFINGYSPGNFSFYNQNAIQSMSVEDKTFDVIVSNVPSKVSSRYYPQRLEFPNLKTDKKSVLKDDLLSKIEESNLQDDKNVMDALKILIEEVEASESVNEISFEGEYESLNDSEFLFIINMLNALKDDGMMAISVSQNFLFKKSLNLLRKFLTHEKCYIDAVISVPEELGRGIRPEVIIVFKKNKNTKDIVFIDISQVYTTSRSPNTVPGLFRKNLVLSEECLNKIVDIYMKREKINKISNVVDLNELKANNYNLSISRYVDTYEGDFINLNELKEDKINIDSKMIELNKKIEKLMNELDIRL